MSYVVGLMGAIGSGKTTVARILEEEHDFRVIEFSTKLKDICADLFAPLGVPGACFYGTQAQKNKPIEALTRDDGSHPTGREILQHIGTEGFRAIDPGVWTRHLFATVDAADYNVSFAVPGLRFPNEAEEIRKRGGEIWRVECIGGPNAGERTGHASDEEWRGIVPDQILVAEYGDIPRLRRLVYGALND